MEFINPLVQWLLKKLVKTALDIMLGVKPTCLPIFKQDGQASLLIPCTARNMVMAQSASLLSEKCYDGIFWHFKKNLMLTIACICFFKYPGLMCSVEKYTFYADKSILMIVINFRE